MDFRLGQGAVEQLGFIHPSDEVDILVARSRTAAKIEVVGCRRLRSKGAQVQLADDLAVAIDRRHARSLVVSQRHMLENIVDGSAGRRTQLMPGAGTVHDVCIKLTWAWGTWGDRTTGRLAGSNMKMHAPPDQAVPLKDRIGLRDIRWINPALKGKAIASSDIQAGTGRNEDILICVVEIERLPHFAGRETNRALQSSVVGAENVVGIAFGRPPGNQPRRLSGRGMDRIRLPADARDNFCVHRIAPAIRGTGEVQHLFIGDKSFVNRKCQLGEDKIGRSIEGRHKIIREHLPLGVGPVQYPVGVAVYEIVRLVNPGVGGAAQEGGGIHVGGRILAGDQIVADVVEVIGETGWIIRRIIQRKARKDSPVIDHVVHEIQFEVVTQARAGAGVVRVEIVVERQRAVAEAQA